MGLQKQNYDPQCIHMDMKLVYTSYASLKHWNKPVMMQYIASVNMLILKYRDISVQ